MPNPYIRPAKLINKAYLILSAGDGNDSVITPRLDFTGDDDLSTRLCPNRTYSVSLSTDYGTGEVFGN